MINILILIFLLIFTPFALAGLSLAPWVPTRKNDLARIFSIVNIKPGQIFFDLGCGDGRVVFYAATNYNIKAIGIEKNWLLYLWCLFKKRVTNNKKVAFKRADIVSIDLKKADVVYVFGLPATNQKMLGEKLQNELKQGTRIISYAFKFTNWRPEIINQPNLENLPIYLYIKK